MKKLILLFCFLLISSISYSQLLTDDFSYTTGQPLTDNTWNQVGGVSTNPILVTDPGLSYNNYAGSGVGNAATLINPGQDVYKDFAAQTSGSIYTSFMVNVISGRTGDYCLHLAQAGSTNAFYCRFYVQDAGNGNIAFGISKTSTSVTILPAYTSAVYTTGTTYLIVTKYKFNAGAADDEVSLFVFNGPIASTEPLPTVGPVTTTQADAVDLGRINLRQGNEALSVIIDGINIDLTWNNSVLPVELASFTSTVSNRDVTLNWSTASELNNSGFEIERSSNNEWTKVGNVNGNGTSSTVNNYSYTDRSLATGSYSYRLKQVDFNGNFEYFNLNNEVNIGTPSTYALSQNYPNPFNPSTTINFDLPTDGNVSLKLYDMSGKEVATLVNEVRSAGYYSVNFNASQLTSGVYFYSISADNLQLLRKCF
jgi:hypothetical protein